MPARNKSTPAGVTMPGTLKRSPAKARRTYAKTLAAAEQEYGSGERAARTAYASLKHSFEKVGDHWEPKARKGPSKAELMERAQALGIRGRSTMNKQALAKAIASKQD